MWPVIYDSCHLNISHLPPAVSLLDHEPDQNWWDQRFKIYKACNRQICAIIFASPLFSFLATSIWKPKVLKTQNTHLLYHLSKTIWEVFVGILWLFFPYFLWDGYSLFKKRKEKHQIKIIQNMPISSNWSYNNTVGKLGRFLKNISKMHTLVLRFWQESIWEHSWSATKPVITEKNIGGM